MNTWNIRVLKEPLGFIRIIEFPMAILAFATTAGYSATTTIDTTKCDPENKNHNKEQFAWGYPFALNSLSMEGNLCDGKDKTILTAFPWGAQSQAQFFVFVGVICFLYILGILAVYLLAWSKYENDGRFALIDFLVTAVLAVFWFIASCAWASGLNSVKSVTSHEAMDARFNAKDGPIPCRNYSIVTPQPAELYCTVTNSGNYASLNVSVIAGFACFGLWLANLWFIYKETPWYKARQTMTTTAGGAGAGPGFGAGAGPTSSTGGNTFR